LGEGSRASWSEKRARGGHRTPRLKNIARRALLDPIRPPSVEVHPIGNLFRAEGHLVRHQDARHVVAGQVADDVEDFLDRLRVQRSGHLRRTS
jgi:hypothetical protein